MTLNETVEVVTCIIVAKGVLLQTVDVPITFDDSKLFQTATFGFNATFAYAPIASIIAYIVREDGRIISASTSVELTRDLRNYVSLRLYFKTINDKELIKIYFDNFNQFYISINY